MALVLLYGKSNREDNTASALLEKKVVDELARTGSFSAKFRDDWCFVEQLGKPAYRAFEKCIFLGDLGVLPS